MVTHAFHPNTQNKQTKDISVTLYPWMGKLLHGFLASGQGYFLEFQASQ